MPNKHEKYYRTLDLDVGASKEEVKKAFRELSHIWHPDNHMGKSSSVQNRATEKFKEISSAYQGLNDYLNNESSSSRKNNYEKESAREAEEKRRAEKERRDREEKERRQQEEKKKAEKERRDREEKERRQQEEKKKAEKERRDREEKERKHWEEQAKKKHEEEKNKQKNAEDIFVRCPKCKRELKRSTTPKLRVICKFCGHIFHYFFENDEIRVVSDVGGIDSEEGAQTVSVIESDFSWGRDFWSWAWFFPALVFAIFLIPECTDSSRDSRSGKASIQDSKTKIARELNQNSGAPNSPDAKKIQSDSISWARSYKGIISGKQGLTMHLQREGDKLNGSYMDIHELEEKRLSGSFSTLFETEKITLGEYLDGKITGTFFGKFTSAKTIEGEYVSQSDSSDKFSFKLEEIQDKSEIQNKINLPPVENKTAEDHFNLGVMHYSGQGVPQDYREAYKWFYLSANQGHAKAQYKLGVMHKEGQGVLQDYGLAYKWLNIAEVNGHKESSGLRKLLERKMTPQRIEKSIKMAESWTPKGD
jgi:hypothetical protein